MKIYTVLNYVGETADIIGTFTNKEAAEELTSCFSGAFMQETELLTTNNIQAKYIVNTYNDRICYKPHNHYELERYINDPQFYPHSPIDDYLLPYIVFVVESKEDAGNFIELFHKVYRRVKKMHKNGATFGETDKYVTDTLEPVMEAIRVKQ